MNRELWIVTGLSGAGKSLALKCLEDLGFWCVDNLPAPLMKSYVELEAPSAEACGNRRAMGLRGIEQLKVLEESLANLPDDHFTPRLLFLECEEATLVKRYSESRRRHPLISSGRGLLKALRDERDALKTLRERADYVIDTTNLTPHTLMMRLDAIQATLSGQSQPLLVHIQSFGFKNGAPSDSEWLWDVRFLPNPYYDPELRECSGVEEAVSQVVFGNSKETALLDSIMNSLLELLPLYPAQGRRQVNIGVGCTGGQHRSVATAEKFAELCLEAGFAVSVFHRDAKFKPELSGARSRHSEPRQEVAVASP